MTLQRNFQPKARDLQSVSNPALEIRLYTGSGPRLKSSGIWSFLVSLTVAALLAGGCTQPQTAATPRLAPSADTIKHESADLRIAVLGIIGAEEEGTLVEDPGWLEYVIEVRNRGKTPLVVQNVRLLNRDGRYVDSASTYEEIIAPPEVAEEIAGQVATTAAGVAAGQVIPFGGTVVRLITGAASASAAESKANARRAFALRVLKQVELAPGGKVRGSAFLPNITNAKSLVLDYSRAGKPRRIELPLRGRTR